MFTRTRFRAPLALLVLSILRLSVMAAPPDPAGHWEGALSVRGQDVKTIVDLKKDETGWSGTISMPRQGLNASRVVKLAVDGAQVSFEIPGPSGTPTFKGTLSEDGQTIAGDYTQGPLKATFSLRRVSPEEQAAAELREAQMKLESMWLGTLKAGVAELRLFLKIYRDPEGKLSGKLDSIDQGAKDIEVPTITIAENQLSFEMKNLGSSYEGTFNEAQSTISGQWSQSGQKFPLTFAKTDQAPVVMRPQEPKPPFPYRSEDVTYENTQAGVRLAGTLTIPKGAGPFPAVILISGSGPQDRNESLMGHKPFLVLADFLTRQGVAVLRVDDRGVGGSSGDLESSTSQDLAGDVESGIKFLQTRGEIDSHRIGLIGHSEGGIIAPIVAVRSADVAFIVLLAAPGLPGEQILYSQARLLGKAAGAGDETLESSEAFQRTIFSTLKEEKDPAAAEKILREKFAALTDSQKQTLNLSEGAIDAKVKTVLSPWFRFFLTYDPRPTLKQVRCPVLAVNGALDLQVPANENLPAIAAALNEGGNKDHKTIEFAKLNHLFQSATTGLPAEYGQIQETMSILALDLIGVWIREHTTAKP